MRTKDLINLEEAFNKVCVKEETDTPSRGSHNKKELIRIFKEYIGEAEHMEGIEYWDTQFKDVAEIFADMAEYARNLG